MFDQKSIFKKQTIHYACKFRIYPTEDQKIFFSKQFGCCRFVYNYLLSYTQEAYRKRKETVSIYEAKKKISELKKIKEYAFLKEVNSQSLQASALNLGSARNRFFKKLGDYPRFKRKLGSQSCEIPQHFLLKKSSRGNWFLLIPKNKRGIKIKVHRMILGEIRHVTITLESDGRYYASLNCRMEKYCVKVVKKWKETGYDLGLSNLLVGDDGKKWNAPRSLRKSEHKLVKKQRCHSKRKKGGKNKEKSRVKLAKCHTKVKNQRKDFLHKISNEIVNENQVLYFETLSLKNMMKNRCLAKSVSDASLGMLLEQFKYKAKWRSKELVQIGCFEPSSKLCSCCGAINKELKLHHRVWTCKICGVLHDRDINAAKNIKKIGQDMSKFTPVERATPAYFLERLSVSWLNEAGSGS